MNSSTTHPARRAARWAGLALAAALVVALVYLALAPDPIEVEVAEVRRGPMQVTVDQRGEVRVQDRYIVSAPVAARVLRSTLRDGDAVERGQIVAVLEPLPMDARQRQEALARLEAERARVGEARQNVAHVVAELEQARRDRERAERLVADKFVSPEALDKARTGEQTARSTVEAARARERAAVAEARAAEAALLALDPGRANRLVQLTTPVSGRVLRVMQQSAGTIPAGATLVVIGDPARFEIVADVLSTDAVKIPAGAPALIEQWGGDRSLRGQVRLVEPFAFTKVSSLGIEEKRVNVVIDPLEPLGPLGDGYRVEARIVIWSAADVLKVPASAVFRSGEAWSVFVVAGNRAVRREVTVGHRNPNEVEIHGGLEPGVRVIKYPGSELREGARVRTK